MKTTMGLGLVVGTMMAWVCADTAWANSAPQVTNVTASQRTDGSNLIDIYYSLADADGDACTVWTAGSLDGGATWALPMLTLSGDVGSGISPGAGKRIVWDGGANAPGTSGSLVIRVYADDGHLLPDMVRVYGGLFPYQGGQWTDVPTFYIDKYEVTNSQYCEFLNLADPDSDHWDSSMKIVRNGIAGSYVYGVVPGFENHPMASANFYDAQAFGVWRSTRDGVTYRLPTEQEWEKAAAWDPNEARYYTYGFHQDVIGCEWCNFSTCENQSMPVGSYDGTGGRQDARSFYGCYDMSGNVWEWTSDITGSNPVLRGGAWNGNDQYCQCSNRYPAGPNTRYWFGGCGFRLVQHLE